MKKSLFPAVFMLVGALLPLSASAVIIGQTDTFEDAIGNWYAGENAAPPAPPQVIADGGPNGAGDAFLKITSQGGSGPGSRLAAINNSQWSGDYVSSGIKKITMDLNNQGISDLTVRIFFSGAAGQAVTEGVFVPSASGWVNVEFFIDPGTLTSIFGDVAAILSNTSLLRIVHNPGVGNAVPVAGVLGVDNISAQSAAVPLPAGLWLMLSGLLALTRLIKR